MKNFYFDDVTLLITHYNRSKSLERLLNSFFELGCNFEKIIVSDDSSSELHKNYIINLQDKYSFDFITTDINRGLGNNINKGQAAVSTSFVLYVQEDFIPQACFPNVFTNSLDVIKQRSDIDMVRYYAHFVYPYLNSYNNGFSDMNFKIWHWGYKKFYVYSDLPHLRRKNFSSKFGKYEEGKNSDLIEYRMMFSFLKKKGKAIIYNESQVFLHINSDDEPSTVKRNIWRESNNIFIHLIREVYRYVKFNFDYFF
jgi:hypothetical protein